MLVGKCRYFADVNLWPRLAYLDPPAWLTNFPPEEERHALHLLNSFTYFSADLVQRLFVGAFQRLSQLVVQTKGSFLTARGEWRRFVSSALIVRVTGEDPSDADSGYIFTRLARDFLGVSERNIVSPDAAIARLIVSPTTPVVFVDDFVGSGSQFGTLWGREYEHGRHGTVSFRGVAGALRTKNFFYCPLICTTQGHDVLAMECPQVCVVPAHLLDARYSALHPNSLLWPDNLRADAVRFIETASARAGIPDLNGAVGDWRGFHKLGLALAFAHGTPDATLPLFTWSQNGWKPLIRRP
jgi:hypothetical protein